MIFLSFIFAAFLYLGAVSNLWDVQKRKIKMKYMVLSKYAFFKLKVMRVGGIKRDDSLHLARRLKLVSDV